MKDVQKMPGANIGSDHNLLVVKICTRKKKSLSPKKENQNGMWRSYITNNRKCKQSRKKNSLQLNVKVWRNYIKKCVLDNMSDLIGKADRKARKSWITQEIINKTDEQKKNGRP